MYGVGCCADSSLGAVVYDPDADVYRTSFSEYTSAQAASLCSDPNNIIKWRADLDRYTAAIPAQQAALASGAITQGQYDQFLAALQQYEDLVELCTLVDPAAVRARLCADALPYWQERLQTLEQALPRLLWGIEAKQEGAQATYDVVVRDIDWLRTQIAECGSQPLPPLPTLPVAPPPPPGTEYESYLLNGIVYVFNVGHGVPAQTEIEQATSAYVAGTLPVDADGYPVANFRSGTLAEIVTMTNGTQPPQQAGAGKGLAVLAALLTIPFFVTR